MDAKVITKCPGFIDLQVNGFMGVDFSDPSLTEEQFISACQALLKKGTAAFLPTLITSSPAVYEHNLPLIARVIQNREFQGRLLGIHLEGPFISQQPGAVGAHNPEYVQKPDLDFLLKLLDLGIGAVKLLTVAAELPGVESLIEYAVSQGITVSIGHSLFDSHMLYEAARSGALAMTHLGNGLPNLLPRHPNPIWAGLACDAFTAMLITDGHHLPDEVIKVAVRAKGSEKFIVVSDAAPVAGLPPGHYTFSHNDAILEESGKFHNPAKQCLVGSSATMIQCMNHMASLGLLTLDELLAVGVYNPLKLIRMDYGDWGTEAPIGFDHHSQRFRFLSP